MRTDVPTTKDREKIKDKLLPTKPVKKIKIKKRTSIAKKNPRTE
jgi:hypothetical protein